MRSQSSHSGPNDSLKYLNRSVFDFAHGIRLTTIGAAHYLEIKTRTILSWTRSRKIKAYSLTGTKRRVWRFLQSNLEAIFIHSTPVLSSAQPSVPCSKGAR